MSEAGQATAAQATTGAPATTSQTVTAPVIQSTGGVSSASTEPVNPGSWMSGFNDDLKGYVGLKGFKGPDAVVDAYRNLEKKHGAGPDKLMVVPDRFYDDKGVMTPEGRQIYERLGAPKDAKEYGLEKFVPKENGDPKLMEEFSKVFQEAGIPLKAAEKIAESWNSYQARVLEAVKEQAQAKFRDADTAIRKEWGAAYEQNLNIAKEGMRRLGISTQEIDSLSATLGHDKTMKLLKNLGSSVGESAFITGKNPNTVMEPGTAKARIKELMGDKAWFKRLEAGGTEEKAEWTRLHQQAYQGEIRF